MSRFVHLHLHTEHSIKDGAIRIDKLMDKVSSLGQSAVAITDHGSMGGIVPAYLEAKNKGVKLIIGCEFYIEKEERHHLVLLAKNEVGYQNILKLYQTSYKGENFYYSPTVSEEDVFKHSEGVICLSACIGGVVSKPLLKEGDITKANTIVSNYKKVFGDDFYLEIQPHEMDKQGSINRTLVELADKHNIKLVATADAHYLNKEDNVPHEVLLAVKQNKTMNDEKRWKFPCDSLYVMSEGEMRAALINHLGSFFREEMITNTMEIANKCNVELDMGSKMPHYPKLTKDQAKIELGNKMNKWYRANKDKLDNPIEYVNRIKHELKIINDKDFAGYFLIVADYCNAFEDMTIEQYGIIQNLMLGSGRGSGVGSLVAFALGITKVDPLKYNLLFERFLNPDRMTEPDFDIDFDYEERYRIIEYMRERYGEDHVARISAYGTLQPKAVFKDVLRTFGYSTQEQRRISKAMPEVSSVEEALKDLNFTNAIKGLDKELDIIKALEGLVSIQSIHAGGLVVTDKPISTLAPCHRDRENGDIFVLSLDKYKCEKMGFVKFDFLGLKTMTVLRKALARVKKTHGVDISLWDLNKEDKEVYKTLNSGNLVGVFQLDGDSCPPLIEKLKPSRFDDIIALEAVCRPGVKEAANFINKTNHSYGIKEIDSILDNTYGAIIFQEQTMLLMNVVTGGKWSLGKADGMRKVKDLQEYKDDFLACSVFPREVAEHIWGRFSLEYSFNKSHAVAYAYITYATAWLLTHYPVEYLCEYIDIYKANKTTTLKGINQAKALGIKILPPNLNATHLGYDVVDGAICFGLSGIDGIGEKAVAKLMEYTAKNKITTLQELIDSKAFNKTGILAAIKVGCFDKEGERNELINRYISTRSKKERESEMVLEYDNKIKLAWEKKCLGIYLTSHPLDKFHLKNYNEVLNDGLIGGIITMVKEIVTKKGDKMCFVQIEDKEGVIDITVFPRLYKKLSKAALVEGTIIMSRGRKDGQNKWIADTLEKLGEV